MGVLPNKIEHHKHYQLALRLGYNDARAHVRTHEHRYDTYEYRVGYWVAMERWGKVRRAIWDFHAHYCMTGPDVRSPYESRRKFRKRRRRKSRNP